MIVFERGCLLWIFNFHPTKVDYIISISISQLINVFRASITIELELPMLSTMLWSSKPMRYP